MSTRVGWINRLTKNELVQISTRLGLPTEGTFNELRAQLVSEIRNMSSEDNEPTGSPREPQGVPKSEILKQINRWGGHFEGKNAEDFIDRLEDLHESYGVTPEQTLKCLAEILRGKALQWYRNEKNKWITWEDFMKDFRRTFISRDRLFHIEDTIRNRLQKQGEPVWEYVVDLRTLMRRHGGFSEDDQVARVYRNLQTEYRKFLRRDEIKTLPILLERAEEYEQILTEERQRSTQRAATIETKGPEKKTIKQEPIADAISTNYEREKCCWRCGQRGHQRLECRRPPQLFCSFCGTTGRTTIRCPCNATKSGNENRIGGRGATRLNN